MISVIVPLYNKEKSIGRCLESIIHQSIVDWECIVVDDGSTDNSKLIVKKFLDKRILYFYKDNGGVSSARNFGFSRAAGKYVLFLDADDYLLPKCLEILLTVILKYNTSVAVGNYYLDFENYKKIHGKCLQEGIIKHKFLYNYWRLYSDRAGTTLYKKDILPQNLFNTSLSRYEDTECMIKIMEKHEFAYSPKLVMAYTNDYAGLSKLCDNPYRDYAFTMNLSNKSFWEKMILVGYLRQALIGYTNHRKELIKIHGINILWVILEYPLFIIRRILKKINLI